MVSGRVSDALCPRAYCSAASLATRRSWRQLSLLLRAQRVSQPPSSWGSNLIDRSVLLTLGPASSCLFFSFLFVPFLVFFFFSAVCGRAGVCAQERASEPGICRVWKDSSPSAISAIFLSITHLCSYQCSVGVPSLSAAAKSAEPPALTEHLRPDRTGQTRQKTAG